MNKLIYGGALILALGISVASCNKSGNTSSDFYTKEATKAPENEKSTWASDADLIDAIKGRNQDYVSISALEDYLYDNAKLSDDVVQTLIGENRVPDYVVETALVLSAPLSSSALNSLAAKRPNISATTIAKANDIPASVGFAIINTSHRQIIFGNDIVKKVKPGNEECGCGDGVITVGSNFAAVTLGTTTQPLDPSEMRPCNSGNVTWTCGDVVYADQTGGGSSTATYTIQCNQSTNKCFKNPKDARRDYDAGH